MTLDIEKLRADTPGCKEYINFNNAGTSFSPRQVLNAIQSYQCLEQQIGGYEAQADKQVELDSFYHHAAKLIHCQPDDIAFTENASRAWNNIFHALPWQRGDTILTCLSEYSSNYIAFLQVAKHYGVEIKIIENDVNGQISLKALTAAIDDNVKLIAMTHIPTNNGLINPVAEIGRLAKQAKIPYLLDTTQSIGQIPVDVNEIGCDFLCATGRKFLRGPRGTGFLYVNTNKLHEYNYHPPFLEVWSAKLTSRTHFTMRNDARRFESWEVSFANKIGLTTAIEYLLKLGVENTWQRIQMLSKLLRQELSKISSITLHDVGEQQCGIVTFTHANMTPMVLKKYLRTHNVNISVILPETSYLDMTAKHIEQLARASVHYYNTESEILRFCELLAK